MSKKFFAINRCRQKSPGTNTFSLLLSLNSEIYTDFVQVFGLIYIRLYDHRDLHGTWYMTFLFEIPSWLTCKKQAQEGTF